MSTVPVVINLNVFKHRCLYLVPVVPPFQYIRFRFQCFEETLRTGIVPTVPPSAHALPGFGTAIDEHRAKLFRAILHAPVRVEQQPFTGTAVVTGHHKRPAHTPGLEAIRHRPAQNLTIPQIDDDGQIKPT